jgi:hypothetical protein
MRNLCLVIICCLAFISVKAQDLNAKVVVNAQLTGNENLQVFKTLEKQLTEFINNTTWTNRETEPNERINCNFVINITEYTNNFYTATLQIQSSRPVFGSTYTTSLYNVNDKDFTFNYNEFQQLIYTPNQYQSNLVSVLAFHIYMVLGLDADSFASNGGDAYFKQAQNIVNFSQRDNFAGWKLSDGLQSRFVLIDNLLSPAFSDFRTINYNYHRLGLDLMNENIKEGKEQMAKALLGFNSIAKNRPNSYLTRVFFDTKAEEIQQIFSEGPAVEVAELTTVLNRIAPMYANKWRNIQFQK